MAFREIDEYRSCPQHVRNILAVNGSTHGWWEWIRPIALTVLIADFLREFGQLVRIASINDTLGVLFSGVSALKFRRQLAENILTSVERKKKTRRIIQLNLTD